MISVVSLNTENVPGFHHPAPSLVLLFNFILVTSDQDCKQYPRFGDGMGSYWRSEILFPPNSMALVLMALGRQDCTYSQWLILWSLGNSKNDLALLDHACHIIISGINSHPHSHKHLMNSAGLHKGHCGERKSHNTSHRTSVPELWLEKCSEMPWPLWPCSGQSQHRENFLLARAGMQLEEHWCMCLLLPQNHGIITVGKDL